MSVRHPPSRLRRAALDAAVATEALRQRLVKSPLARGFLSASAMLVGAAYVRPVCAAQWRPLAVMPFACRPLDNVTSHLHVEDLKFGWTTFALRDLNRSCRGAP
jgi:hypothetical protein